MRQDRTVFLGMLDWSAISWIVSPSKNCFVITFAYSGLRASEKRFYQKVRDLFALSSDYQIVTEQTQLFFASVQNKLLFAATGQTAAELIVDRADPSSPNMALTTWKGSRVRKQDVVVAKNYLSADEIDTLERLVTIFLEQAELRVKQKNDLTLAFWQQNVDRMLAFNDQPILDGPGTVSPQGNSGH